MKLVSMVITPIPIAKSNNLTLALKNCSNLSVLFFINTVLMIGSAMAHPLEAGQKTMTGTFIRLILMMDTDASKEEKIITLSPVETKYFTVDQLRKKISYTHRKNIPHDLTLLFKNENLQANDKRKLYEINEFKCKALANEEIRMSAILSNYSLQ